MVLPGEVMCTMLARMPSDADAGAIIRRARLHKRMSQGELAEKLGVSRSAVNAWERGRAYPQNPVAVEEELGISLGGEPVAAGPLDDLLRTALENDDEEWAAWEAGVLENDLIPVETRRWVVTESRAARARSAARREAQGAARPHRDQTA